MFYDAIENKHGMKHDPFKALMVPRPIGWISTISTEGVANIAPYSFFNAVAERPSYVVFGSAGIKDSLKNINDTGEFCCSAWRPSSSSARVRCSGIISRRAPMRC